MARDRFAVVTRIARPFSFPQGDIPYDSTTMGEIS